jgi:hypothetical protein
MLVFKQLFTFFKACCSIVLSHPLQLVFPDVPKNNLKLEYTLGVDLAILLSDAISIETVLSFQITTTGDSDKHVMFYRLCKYHFKQCFLTEHDLRGVDVLVRHRRGRLRAGRHVRRLRRRLDGEQLWKV